MSQTRLAAIMFTDIVGYTSIGQTDEPLALELLETHNRLVRGVLPNFHGIEVKTMGDSFLVEFESAIDAASCAIEVQRVLREYNRGSIDDRRVMLRIGIHLGDVVHRGSDVLGDAVNVASRIEPLAEPGGVCVSQQVYDQIRNKLRSPMTKIEPGVLKNVQFAVGVYKIGMPWDSPSETSAPTTKPTGSTKTRVAVLPFVNISPEPGDEYFADGMTEELIATASSITGLTFIARTSVMRYKGLTKGVEEIGKELNVGTVLEGSVRKAGSRLRINVQLIDVESQGHLWAESYDRELDDVFAIQGDIAKRVADVLKVRLLPSEVRQIDRRPTKSSEAYTLYLKGRHYWNARNREGLLKAIEYFELALVADPDYAQACSGISDCYTVLGDHKIMPYDQAFPKAKDYASRAVQLDDSSAETRTSLGASFQVFNEWDDSERELKKALELNPGYATAHHWYGLLLMRTGRLEEGLREALLAQELDPVSPQIKAFIGGLYNFMGKYDEAEEQLRESLELDPDLRSGRMILFEVYCHEGKLDEAEREVEDLLRLTNNDPYARGLRALVYVLKGREEEARRMIAELDGVPGSNVPVINAHLRLGDREKAIGLIQKEFEDHANWLPELAFDRDYESVKSDPRILSILGKIGSSGKVPE
jgi:adenylate cyclase